VRPASTEGLRAAGARWWALQQRAVRQNFRYFSRLPPQQRAQLRERWIQATPLQRQQMLQRQRDRRQQHSR